jgi:hypothetical protein
MAPVLQSTNNFTLLGMLAGTDVVVKSVLALLVLASLPSRGLPRRISPRRP